MPFLTLFCSPESQSPFILVSKIKGRFSLHPALASRRIHIYFGTFLSASFQAPERERKRRRSNPVSARVGGLGTHTVYTASKLGGERELLGGERELWLT